MNLNENIPAALGAPFAGGYYAGQYKVGDQLFALVMAGAAGELSGRWSADSAAVDGALSESDGLANTQAMVAAGSKLAERVHALDIGGFTDWFIPAKDELEMLYRAFKPSTARNWEGEGENAASVPPGAAYTRELPAQTAIEALREDEPDALVPAWYWSSTQHACNADYAWYQFFLYGFQLYGHKSYAGRARAVRRLPI